MIDAWWQGPLEALSDEQWEQLCDGCGLCCLHKLEDEDTGELHYTQLACDLLNTANSQCSDYPNRLSKVPACLKLTKANYADAIPWLPASCAYKRVAQGDPLPSWHHLITGDRQTIHSNGASVAGKVRHAKGVAEDDYQDYLLRWVEIK